MLSQRPTQRVRSALIEQDTHLRGSERAACGVIEHRTNLAKRDARKPFDELRHGGAILQILKERGYGHARAAEYPLASRRVQFRIRT